MVVAHIVGWEQVDVLIDVFQPVGYHFRGVVGQRDFKAGVAIGLYSEIQSCEWGEVEFVGDRHSVAYIDRQVEIDKCGLCFDRNQVKVQIVGNVPVIENKPDIQPFSLIDGLCVGYFEVDVVD